MKSPSRLDTSSAARWWWSVDRMTLALVSSIVMVGIVLLMAAGPPAAARYGIADDFYFPMRQYLFLPPALGVMMATSFLTPLQARRLGVFVFAGALLLMIAALLFAPEINGAHRWLYIGPVGLQPSEFVKPGFIVFAAWMLAESARNPAFPGKLIAGLFYVLLLGLLIAQPDYGQAALVGAVGLLMFFIVGWSWASIAALGAGATGALGAGYYFAPHLAKRIHGFLNPDGEESYQVDKALEAIRHGGLFGRGGEGATVKMQVPDPHTDFIFAVAGEEGGFVLGFVIIAVFAALVLRLLVRATASKSLFAQTAVCGLAAMIGLQAFINIGVSLRALPAKGMTLPFVSYGGSSLLATGLAFGLALALTRAHGGAARRREIMP